MSDIYIIDPSKFKVYLNTDQMSFESYVKPTSEGFIGYFKMRMLVAYPTQCAVIEGVGTDDDLFIDIGL